MIGERPHVAILGAGPAGLDAALEAAARGWGFTLYEAADEPAGGVRSWGHVSLFSPWSIDASTRMRSALGNGRDGHAVPDTDVCPTGRELAETLLDRVAALPRVEPHLRLGTRVVAVGREGLVKNEEISTPERARRPFRLLVVGPDGRERIE
ncbi:MAG TPA: flavoprotein, partial [Thermoanaerobaculia bacterium]